MSALDEIREFAEQTACRNSEMHKQCTRQDRDRLLAAVEAGMDTLDERARQLRETANRLDQQVMDGDKDRHPSDADRYNQYAAATEAAAWHLRMTITTALEAKS